MQHRGVQGGKWFIWCAALMLAAISVSASAAVPQPQGWTQRFAEDFNGPAGQLPASSRWRFDLGHGNPGGGPNWGTYEVEANTARPENVSLDGKGHLRITPRRDANGQWTSARIETRRDDFHAPAGGMLRIEARIRMPDVHGPAALGYWPAFWALGKSFRTARDWPASGEIDVMENVNGLNRVWGTLHCGVSPGGPCHEKHGLSADVPCPGASCQAAFHTYTVEWDRSVSPQVLRWYVDGKLYHTLRQDQLPAATWNRMSTRKGMYLILDVAIGGLFPDRLNAPVPTPTSATQPGHPMLVDYVAVWTRAKGEAVHTTP
ncbi:glycoside hydrolase family 16 protein [Oleiagrimonas sp.]|uniref:glycoside hydrolase family 16 protein n=1 Tax=Oleiagrimonas sp. TaxID=2010330 RepID=UPI00262DA81B|nr:glycoside hydrolase family 16 protein [Oleiagrimonas sp.]MDA3914628.1 glycoside hydrolase family 16 protein [Oleiagrimonas sp.]